jgi:hypothetical protein
MPKVGGLLMGSLWGFVHPGAIHCNTIITIDNRFLIDAGYCWQRCHVARLQPSGAALLLLVGVVDAQGVATLPRPAMLLLSCSPAGLSGSFPLVGVLLATLPLHQGIQRGKPSKAAIVDLPAIFLYSRPIRGVSFA